MKHFMVREGERRCARDEEGIRAMREGFVRFDRFDPCVDGEAWVRTRED